jgi:hypothetical protein
MQRRYLIPALAALAVVLALPAAASAAPVVKGPPTFHARFEEDYVIDDFCGTGESVSVHAEARATVWEDEPGAFKEILNRKNYYTYAGVTLVEHVAGRTVAVVVPAQAGAARTEKVIETGLRAQLKLPHGGVLTSDHGLLHYLISFDEEGNFVGIELLDEHGGHPAFTTGGEAWCEAATAAFGLPFPS